VGVLW